MVRVESLLLNLRLIETLALLKCRVVINGGESTVLERLVCP